MPADHRALAGEEHRLGLELVPQGRIEEAIAAFTRAVDLDPLSAITHLDLGAALRLAGRRAEAITALRQALALQPALPAAQYNLGTTLLEMGDIQGALDALREAVSMQPDSSFVHVGLGMALYSGNRWSEARAALERALVLDPDSHLASHFLGMTHWVHDDPTAAISILREGIRRSAAGCQDCHLALSLALLKSGEYAAGWSEYEWRWRAGGQTARLTGLEQPVWDGCSPLDGKAVVLWAEQGLGDILQFVRFASALAARGAIVHLLSRPNLDGLLTTCPGVARVVSCQEDLGDFDYQLPMASLPRLLGVCVGDLPAVGIPYLTPPVRRSDPFGPRRDGALRVGIVWAVEKGQPNWEQRSCPLPLFRVLEEISGVELYSLQFGSRSAELRQPGAPRAADLSAVLGDFANTAALIEHLDLVITVDTSMAHLTGAMGRPVWTLIPHLSDWRWLRDRDDSPWYPTMRLFRQDQAGGWEPVLARVAAALTLLQA